MVRASNVAFSHPNCFCFNKISDDYMIHLKLTLDMKILYFFSLGLVSYLYKNLHLISSRLKNNLKSWPRLARRDLAIFEARRDLVFTSNLHYIICLLGKNINK